MADYIDGSSSEQAGISRRSLIKKGMVTGGVGLWAVPVLAVVTRNGAEKGGEGTTQMITPATHVPGHVEGSCTIIGSPGPNTCITFQCGDVAVQCTGTPVGNPATADICFCDTDISGVCRCFANEDCGDLINCPNLGAPNGGCPNGFFCVNPFSCCGVPKCAQVCA